jgi:hypothetical protein
LGDRYFLLKRTWTRPKGELGIIGSGEVGRFVTEGDVIELQAEPGRSRWLKRVDDDCYAVEDPSEADLESKDLSLHGWLLKS